MCCALSTPDLPQPEVRVESDGDSTAGEDFSLQCTVETEEGVRPENISIQWTGPDGGQISSGDNIVIEELTTDGTITTGSLQFSPLSTSDRGQYTCTGRVVASSVEVDVSNSDSIVVIVTSTFSPVLCSGIHVHVCMCTICLHVIVISYTSLSLLCAPQSLLQQCQSHSTPMVQCTRAQCCSSTAPPQ